MVWLIQIHKINPRSYLYAISSFSLALFNQKGDGQESNLCKTYKVPFLGLFLYQSLVVYVKSELPHHLPTHLTKSYIAYAM